jgi:hypothetical protein
MRLPSDQEELEYLLEDAREDGYYEGCDVTAYEARDHLRLLKMDEAADALEALFPGLAKTRQPKPPGSPPPQT